MLAIPALLIAFRPLLVWYIFELGRKGELPNFSTLLGLWFMLAAGCVWLVSLLFRLQMSIIAKLIAVAIGIFTIGADGAKLFNWPVSWIDGFRIYALSRWEEPKLLDIVKRKAISVPGSSRGRWIVLQDKEANQELALGRIVPLSRIFVDANAHGIVIFQWNHGRYPAVGLAVSERPGDIREIAGSGSWRDVSPTIRVFID